MKYNFTIIMTNAVGQEWTCQGTCESKPGDFIAAADDAMYQSFRMMTNGKAQYGKPGVGCEGPYHVKSMHLDKQP